MRERATIGFSSRFKAFLLMFTAVFLGFSFAFVSVGGTTGEVDYTNSSERGIQQMTKDLANDKNTGTKKEKKKCKDLFFRA